MRQGHAAGSPCVSAGARGWASALAKRNVAVDLNVAARIGNVVARGARRKMSSSWLASSRLMKTKTLTLLLTTSSTSILSEIENYVGRE